MCARRTFHWLCGAFFSPVIISQSTEQVSNAQLRKGLVRIVTGCYSILKSWLELQKSNDFFGNRFNIMAADLQLDMECGAQLRKIRLVGGQTELSTSRHGMISLHS